MPDERVPMPDQPVGARSALIVATYEYDDPGLSRLRAPEHDATALSTVLTRPEIGGFEVKTAINLTAHELDIVVAEFFQNRRRDDLLLLHFSCHGVKDDGGDLYLAAKNTRLDLLEATATSATFVRRAMDRTHAGRVLLLLDCCYAGAFGRGMSTRSGGPVDIQDRLAGRGRAVITATSALEFAFEENELVDGEPDTAAPSVFTGVLVEGLSTGEADLDQDGWVTLDELYSYVHDEVRRRNPRQNPKKWALEIEGDFRLTRRAGPASRAVSLPKRITKLLKSHDWVKRKSAVDLLVDLQRGEHPGLALAAQHALEKLAADPDDRVKAAAQSVLPQSPPPAPPPRPSPRRRWLVVAAAAVIALLVAGGLALAVGVLGGPRLADTELLVAKGSSEDGGVLTVIDVETKKQRTLSSLGNWVKWPNPSPDRRWIAYVEATSGGQEPRLARADGKDSRPLLSSAAAEGCSKTGRPAWSPDGERLAVVCVDDLGVSTKLMVVDLTGEVVDTLYRSRLMLINPTWTGDGRIVVSQTSVVEGPGPREPFILHAIAEQGGDMRPLVYDEEESNGHPDWTEAGIEFVRGSYRGFDGDVYRVDIGGGKPIRLTERGDVRAVGVSPNGKARIVWAKEGGTERLVVVEDDGRTDVIASGTFGPPSWGSR